MKKFILGSVVALAVVFGALASTAQAYNFASDLTVGSTGADVTALQTWLVNNGFLVMPAGTAYGYFGQVTKAAVAKYQASAGLPSTGFFGPMTRAKLSSGSTVTSTGVTSTVAGCTPGAMFSSTTGQKCNGSSTTSTISTSGEEGEINNIDTLGGVESSVDEGDEDVEVLGVEFEAEDSDMLVERVDVDFTVGSGGSSNLDDYITAVNLVLDGKKVASADVDEADEDDDVYSFRFTGLKGVVSEGDTAELYVTVDAVSNLDSDDAGVDITVEVPENGIRAVDGAGISDTYVSSTDSLSESFEIEAANVGELTITEADESPDAETVKVDEDNNTNDVTLLVFELEADDQDVEITDLPISLGSTGAGVGEVVKTVKLVQGSKTLDTKSVSSTTATYRTFTFDDLDLTVEDGDTVTLKLVADINDIEGGFTAGDTVTASTSADLSGWDAEDTEGESVDPSGSAVGDAQTFRVEGVMVSDATKTQSVQSNVSDVSTDDQGVYTITFNVEAFEETAYVELGSATRGASTNNTGANYTIESSTNSYSATTTGSVSASLEHVSGGSVSGDYVRINPGNEATLKLTVYFDPALTDLYRLQLYSVNFASTATDEDTQEIVTPAEDFQTSSVSVQN